jgi:hypothetical protein
MNLPNMQMAEADKVVGLGYAKFNNNPHLCVDIPDGNFTITCKTSTGEQVTFSFVPYRTGCPAQCVDIQRHTTAFSTSNGRPIQNVICFTPGSDTFRSGKDDKKPTTLMTLLLHEPKTAEEMVAKVKLPSGMLDEKEQARRQRVAEFNKRNEH